MRVASLLLVITLVGCAARPPHYSGRVEPRRAEPEALLEAAAPSSELSKLGTASVGCTLRAGFRALVGEPLSDLDCSFRRLSWVLRESAAAAGGDVLVGERCAQSARGALRHLQCEAEVARFARGGGERSPLAAPRSLAPERPAPSPRYVERIDEPDATLAARIRLDFTPLTPSYAGAPRAASDVHELAQLPVWDVSLGDLRARCAGSCSEPALRWAVLVAAGRLGAPDVVGVHCAALGGDTECTGQLAVPENER